MAVIKFYYSSKDNFFKRRKARKFMEEFSSIDSFDVSTPEGAESAKKDKIRRTPILIFKERFATYYYDGKLNDYHALLLLKKVYSF